MIFGHVQLPRELQDAIDENRLVIFAGAGISCPPPSNLPLFNELARDICGELVPEGREDRVLGEKYRSKADVYAACEKRLRGAHTSHTNAHEDILRIFKKGDSVRVVTTNFDNHFSTAAKKVYRKDQPKEYYAPALPLGDDFQGIVYLHGSVVNDYKKIVLTDKDFGEAYLTKGWASRFLVDLFSAYTVLFVGYSHNDVTTTYLARGLKPYATQRRWALRPHNATSDELRNWEHLDINVMSYPLNPDNIENTHSRLSDFFSEWAAHRKTKLVSRVKKAKKLGRSLPPESAIGKGAIEDCLQDENLCKAFLSTAKHPAWFSWMEENNHFKTFFSDAGIPFQGSDEAIARWLANYVRLKHPYLLFDIIRRNDNRINDGFARALVHSVWSTQRKGRDKYFSKWVTLLVSCNKIQGLGRIVTYILNECTLPKDISVVLQLFEIATKPRLSLEEELYYENSDQSDSAERSLARKTGFKVGFPGDAHLLTKAWREVISPHLGQVAESFLRLCEKQIYDTYSIKSSIYGSNNSYDSFSWDRSSIAAHGQDASPLYPLFSCLVDILRDILQFFMESKSMKAQTLRQSWWNSNIVILQRLSVYSYSIDNSIAADEAVMWLISKDLIFRSGMKKEVFDVLAKFYSQSSLKIKKRLLKRIERGDNEPRAKNLSTDILEYEKYNVLIWLKKHDTACQFLNNALDQIKSKYPTFSERDHPEFDSWIGPGGWIDPSDGVDFDEILSKSPSEFIKFLKSPGEDPFERGTRGSLSILPGLFKRDHDWACRFVQSLAEEQDIRVDILERALFAFREVPQSTNDWKWLLELLEGLPQRREVYSGVAYLISHSIWNDKTKPTCQDLERAVLLMERAWELCSQNSDIISSVNHDWLTSAINHVGGWISEFWVHYCSHLYHCKERDWEGIPAFIQKIFKNAVGGSTSTQVNARIGLTPWFGYLYTWDPDFSRDVLLPMLDWNRDAVVAQQTWSVMLSYERATSRDLEQIRVPYYREFAKRIRSLLRGTANNEGQFSDQALRNFGSKIAAIAMLGGENPIQSNFINDFIPAMPEISRVGFAIWIKEFLRDTDDGQKEVWDSWLKDYVDLRLMGMPIPLSAEEGNHMIEWCLYLTPVFRDAVDLLVKVPLQKNFAYSILSELRSGTMVDSDPLHACKLVNAALEAEDYPHLHAEI